MSSDTPKKNMQSVYYTHYIVKPTVSTCCSEFKTLYVQYIKISQFIHTDYYFKLLLCKISYK